MSGTPGTFLIRLRRSLSHYEPQCQRYGFKHTYISKEEITYSSNNVALVHGNPLDKTVVRICAVVCNEWSGIADRHLEVTLTVTM